MSEPLLLLDTPYLCHRAFHAMGDLSFGSEGTAAIFGVLRDIVLLQEEFKPGRCVFAFDRGRPHRLKLPPTYKSTRRKRYAEESEEEQAARKDFRRQIQKLCTQYLPAAGFQNAISARGFEADDLIAAVAAALSPNEEAIIVSSDKDLWQCIRPNIWCWNPQKRQAYTIAMFRAEWGIEPEQWAEVKAYAGCATDDVPGVEGVGEKTAAKYIRGDLGEKTKAHAKLARAEIQCAWNMRIVQLPYPNTPTFELQSDEVTEETWQALADELGMHSLRSTVPRTVTRKSRGRKRAKGFFA